MTEESRLSLCPVQDNLLGIQRRLDSRVQCGSESAEVIPSPTEVRPFSTREISTIHAGAINERGLAHSGSGSPLSDHKTQVRDAGDSMPVAAIRTSRLG
jgi:hypothetical protein